ncbi:hypothetical protein STRIP9103_09118 [Streptomyces ipomoeae 91-03]|uniref:Uncharacterized protein n=1 Tax=Streptomyces ipomoeae 91-03 TaxID=698759 RepID=L1KKM2_9ACTN|nr:hypothetical protein STRIP9103_09118 [Streptomyces ipomoeae 91-03]
MVFPRGDLRDHSVLAVQLAAQDLWQTCRRSTAAQNDNATLKPHAGRCLRRRRPPGPVSASASASARRDAPARPHRDCRQQPHQRGRRRRRAGPGGLDRARSSCVAPALLRGVGAGLSASTAAMLIRVVAVYREYPDNGEAGILGARGKA